MNEAAPHAQDKALIATCKRGKANAEPVTVAKHTPTARTRAASRMERFRRQMAKLDCARLEVTLGKDAIALLDESAKAKKKLRWELVEAALFAYCGSASGNGSA